MNEVQTVLDRHSVPHERLRFQFLGDLPLPDEAVTNLLALRDLAARTPQAPTRTREPATPENETLEI
jgi:hypothetical protein